MTRGDLKRLFKEVMNEMNVTGGSASFTPGSGAQYATPKAFKKNKKDKKQY